MKLTEAQHETLLTIVKRGSLHADHSYPPIKRLLALELIERHAGRFSDYYKATAAGVARAKLNVSGRAALSASETP